MKKEAVQLVLRALGVKKLTPVGGALMVWQFFGARAAARRERRERLRGWARRHRREAA